MLARHDADYRAFLEAREQKAQEDHYKKQGELLASALSAKFDESISAAAAAGAKAAGATFFPGLGGSSGAAAPVGICASNPGEFFFS